MTFFCFGPVIFVSYVCLIQVFSGLALSLALYPVFYMFSFKRFSIAFPHLPLPGLTPPAIHPLITFVCI